MRLTVNQISSEYGGSNPSLPTKKLGKKTFLIYNNIIKMKTLNITIAIIGGGAGAGVNDCVMSKSF